MKKLITLASAILVSTISFAAPLNKPSAQLKTLGSAWKTQQSSSPTLDKNDITMGYAGKDLSRQGHFAAAVISA
jgi:hypothetical protein